MIDNGVHGLAAGGSTGEGHVLDREEYIKLMKTTVDSVDGRIPVVAGIVTNSTSEVIARGKSVKDLNVSALQITPHITYLNLTTMLWLIILKRYMMSAKFLF